MFVKATYIRELKNSKSTFSDFSVILSVTKKSYFYTTSGDGNRKYCRALSRDSQLLHLLLAAAADGVESREARVPYLIHFAARS